MTTDVLRDTPSVRARSADAAPAVQRFTSLDGLRGVAAVIVLLHHALLLTPAVSAIYVPGGRPPTEGSMMWWLSYTPLKLLSAGPEAVVLFFVLSGFVLTLPVLRLDRFDWAAYFPRRFVRLSLPVAASVLLAALLVLLHPQAPMPRGSGWLNASSTETLTWDQILNGVNLLNGDYRLNNPLWSIQWEMIFSVMLPLFVLAAVLLRRWWILGIALAIGLVFVGGLVGASAFRFLPMFLMGALIAVGIGTIERFTDRLNASRARHVLWPALLCGAAILIVAPWLIGDARVVGWLLQGLTALVPLGAVLVVFCAIGYRPFARLLSLKPVVFLGTISFSLYLVHVPILVALRHALPAASENVVIVAGIPIALAVAVAFYWAVEVRAHRWSGTVGRWASRMLGGGTRRPVDAGASALRADSAG